MASAVIHSVGGNTILTFLVASETLALTADNVAEIIRLPALTRVPHAPPSLLGVANLRGAVLPVVSLAKLLEHSNAPPSPGSRVVVLAGNTPTGLLVDAIVSLAGTGAGTGASTGGGRLLDLAGLLNRQFGGLLRQTPSRIARADQTLAQPTMPPAPTTANDAMTLLGLRLDSQDYALPLEKVIEILRLPATYAQVPRTDTAMLGIITLRKSLLPLVSLRVLLGLPADGYDPARARIVVTSLGGAIVGLVVDTATAILNIAATSIDPVPPVLTRGKAEAQVDAICRLEGGQRLVCLLSPARLLDKETATLIQSHGEQESTGMSSPVIHGGTIEQFLIFRLGDEQYGLPIATVQEVARRPDRLTRLPHAPGFVEGIMNLRGHPIPVIDQRQRFAAAGDAGFGARVIVVTVDGLQAGFAVDAVLEVLAVPTADLRSAPQFDTEAEPLFDRVAINRGGRMILLISPRALLNQAERDLLISLSETAAVS